MQNPEQTSEHVGPDAPVRAGELRSLRKPGSSRQEPALIDWSKEGSRMSGDSDSQSNSSPLTTKRRGEIAEAAFLLKAASLGFSVAKPWGESDRYDFIVEVHGPLLPRPG
jgi:hypothetical protein